MSETIWPADGPADIEAARALFRAYAASLDFSLDFQGFEAELAGLPGAYAPPRGALLLALRDDAAVGAVALRDLGGGVCEMKRLYLRPEARKGGLGRRLAEAVIEEGRRLGYRAMRLDSLPRQMGAAIALYRSMGFREIPAYYDAGAIPGMLFFELDYGAGNSVSLRPSIR